MSDTFDFALVFVGVLLVVGSVGVGIGAFEYEVKHVGTADIAPKTVEEFVTYEDLEGYHKEVVDRALAGEEVVVRSEYWLPGKRQTKGKLAVDKGGRYYILTRRLFFNWRTKFGMASILLGLAGSAAISEGVRRSQFPDRPVYWVRR